MHSAPFLNLLHTLRRRAMRKGRSIRSNCMNTGNSAILFSPDTCLVGYAKPVQGTKQKNSGRRRRRPVLVVVIAFQNHVLMNTIDDK